MSQRILVLEDDPDFREILVDVLEDEGYQVCACSDSAEALLAGRRFQPDLFVTDIRMKGMDGLDCLAHLRKVLPRFRCIVITGYADEEAPRRAMRWDADDYVRKPFELDAFLATVRRVLDTRERETYQRLVGGLAAGARYFWQAVDGARAMVDRSTLERDRDKLFRSFYVGVRSGDLTLQEALQVWDRLEGLEAGRARLKDESLPAPERKEIVEGYRLLLDTVSALCRADYPYHGRRPPDGVPHRLFQEFHRRVKSGDLSPEQVHLAPLLRRLGPGDLEGNPELRALRSHVWADTA